MELIWLIVLISIASLLLIVFLIVMFLVLLAFKVKGPWDTNGKPWVPSLDKQEDYERLNKSIEWYRNNGEWVSVKSHDGLTLKGKLFIKESAKTNIILFHGYRGLPEGDFGFVNDWLRTLDVNILCIYQRGTLPSEGKTITMGYEENKDVHTWFDYVSKLNNLPILLWGLSMGCASVLMSLQTSYSDRLKGIVADCGYTSIEAQLKDETKKYVGIFNKPIFLIFKMWQRIIYKFPMKKLKTTEILNKTTVPILFVHGDSDTFVSKKYTLANYEAYKGDKDLLLVKNAAHAKAFYVDEETYKNKVTNLLNK